MLTGGCFLLLTGLALLGYLFLSHYEDWPGGMRPTYAAADYDARLTREAATATPVINALNRYHDEHSTFPAHAGDLVPYLPGSATPPGSADEILGWQYRQGEGGSAYVLYRKLGWDPTLQYRCKGATGTWVFDPGDGSEEKPIILKP
jgi:hypothetical protein